MTPQYFFKFIARGRFRKRFLYFFCKKNIKTVSETASQFSFIKSINHPKQHKKTWQK
jgi:hypothetical protein